MLKTNPFYVLNIPMSAGKGMTAAASEAAFLSSGRRSGNESEEAFAVLVNPEQRLTAELGWFPGLDEEHISEIHRAVRNSQPIDEHGLGGISLLNAVLYNLGLKTGRHNRNEKDIAVSCAQAVRKTAELYDSIDPFELTGAINDSRQLAGITLTEVRSVAAAWADRRQEIGRIIDHALKKCSREQYIQTFSNIADGLEADPAALRPVISDAIDRYEINTYAEAEQLVNTIREQKDRINGCRDWNSIVTGNARTRLIKAARRWRDIAKPMMVRADLFKAEYEQGKAVSDYAMDAASCIYYYKTFESHTNMAHELIVSMSLILGRNQSLAAPFQDIVTERTERARESREAFRKTGCYKICLIIVIIMIVETAGLFLFGYFTTDAADRGAILFGILNGLFGLALIIMIPVLIAKNRHRKDR